MKRPLVKKSPRATASFGRRSAKDYLKLPYARILIPGEDGRFSAEVLEFPGCYSQGDSAGEAFTNLEKAAAAWIEACQKLGQEIPPPSANQGFGGRFALRLPRSLHRLAAHKAERDGVSLNQCLVAAIAAWVGADNLFERITRKVDTHFVQMLRKSDRDESDIETLLKSTPNIDREILSQYLEELIRVLRVPEKRGITSPYPGRRLTPTDKTTWTGSRKAQRSHYSAI
jgi:predicted RNase H-like HicB family nuclease